MATIRVNTDTTSGEVQVTIQGVAGPSCVDLLRVVQLGDVVGEEHTDEYYQQAVVPDVSLETGQ